MSTRRYFFTHGRHVVLILYSWYISLRRLKPQNSCRVFCQKQALFTDTPAAISRIQNLCRRCGIAVISNMGDAHGLKVQSHFRCPSQWSSDRCTRVARRASHRPPRSARSRPSSRNGRSSRTARTQLLWALCGASRLFWLPFLAAS